MSACTQSDEGIRHCLNASIDKDTCVRVPSQPSPRSRRSQRESHSHSLLKTEAGIRGLELTRGKKGKCLGFWKEVGNFAYKLRAEDTAGHSDRHAMDTCDPPSVLRGSFRKETEMVELA